MTGLCIQPMDNSIRYYFLVLLAPNCYKTIFWNLTVSTDIMYDVYDINHTRQICLHLIEVSKYITITSSIKYEIFKRILRFIKPVSHSLVKPGA